MIGTYILSAGYYDAYYLKAQQIRTLIRRDYDEAFAHVDVVAVPTTPTAAFRLGDRTDDPLQMYLSDVFTVGAPLAGLPAISIPCGLTPERLPAGLQLTARAFDETTLLRAADAIERRARVVARTAADLRIMIEVALERVPDDPWRVDTRGMLLSGRAEVVFSGAAGSRRPTGSSCPLPTPP